MLLLKKNNYYIPQILTALVYYLTHLTDLPLLSNCQNLFTSRADVFPFPRSLLSHLKIEGQKSNCGVGVLSTFFAVMQCSLFFSAAFWCCRVVSQCPPPQDMHRGGLYKWYM